MKIFNALLPLSMVISSLCLAEEKTNKQNSVGFGIGPTYGAGILYKRQLNEQFALQGSLLPIYSKDSAILVAGFTGFYTLHKGTYGQLYTSFGAAGMSRKSVEHIVEPVQLPDTGIPKPQQIEATEQKMKWDNSFAIGSGVGLQIDFLENFVFCFEIPISFIFDVNAGIRLNSVRPYPNSSILYNF